MPLARIGKESREARREFRGRFADTTLNGKRTGGSRREKRWKRPIVETLPFETTSDSRCWTEASRAESVTNAANIQRAVTSARSSARGNASADGGTSSDIFPAERAARN